MAIVKSQLLKQLSDNYPNFLKKDLEKSLNIVLNEIKLALNKGENVELRDFGTWSVQTQKAKLSRNPKTGEKLGAKVLWLQYGIQNQEAGKIVETANISYIANKCIKQEYQRLFLKISPVFPALKN